MCKKCARVFKKHFGALTEDEQEDIVWGLTAYPFCSCEQFISQIEHVAKIGVKEAYKERKKFFRAWRRERKTELSQAT